MNRRPLNKGWKGVRVVSWEEFQAWATASAKTLRQQVSSLLEEIVRQLCGWRERADEVTGVTRALKAILKVWLFFFFPKVMNYC